VRVEAEIPGKVVLALVKSLRMRRTENTIGDSLLRSTVVSSLRTRAVLHAIILHLVRCDLSTRPEFSKLTATKERTFLAWLRTSLSFASIGIAITQLFRLNTSIANEDDSKSATSVNNIDREKLRQLGKPLGVTFLGVCKLSTQASDIRIPKTNICRTAILILLLGFHRYFESQHYVIRGKFPASRGSIMVVSIVAGALIVASLVVVIAVAPSAFET
jgi:uncharacterized membrane protein YidH (DUF202 family)